MTENKPTNKEKKSSIITLTDIAFKIKFDDLIADFVVMNKLVNWCDCYTRHMINQFTITGR